jgi:protein-S-isoprenylcysteine O-methyltransferase Ste14
MFRPVAGGVFWAMWLVVIACAVWPSQGGRDRGSRTFLAASMAAGAALAAVATADLPAAGLDDGWLWYGLGLGLVAAGVTGRVWSLRATAGAGGPYRLVRYPGYTGILLALAGFGVALDNIVALLATVVVPLPALAYRIAVEERAVPRAVGYPQGRARLIPGVW